ncbi:hypothetical protein M758_UG063700 [Ceratodon purpureus]|nr:hypothetical protein M758_UG063700 [Ceratodon purpureus]
MLRLLHLCVFSDIPFIVLQNIHKICVSVRGILSVAFLFCHYVFNLSSRNCFSITGTTPGTVPSFIDACHGRCINSPGGA